MKGLIYSTTTLRVILAVVTPAFIGSSPSGLIPGARASRTMTPSGIPIPSSLFTLAPTSALSI